MNDNDDDNDIDGSIIPCPSLIILAPIYVQLMKLSVSNMFVWEFSAM